MKGNLDHGLPSIKVSKESKRNFKALYAIECGDIDLCQHLQTAFTNLLERSNAKWKTDTAMKIITKKTCKAFINANVFHQLTMKL